MAAKLPGAATGRFARLHPAGIWTGRTGHRPYGRPPQQSYYGFDQPQAHPLLNGPLTEPSGGTLYFDGDASLQTLQETLRLMGVYETMDYVAFGNSSSDPISERYLDQMRLVSHSALASIFGATTSEPPPQQRLHAPAAVCAFVAAQRSKWNDSSTLAGTAGGDGDWAKESLAFGFHVENTYWGIYRVWSRSWLVTK